MLQDGRVPSYSFLGLFPACQKKTWNRKVVQIGPSTVFPGLDSPSFVRAIYTLSVFTHTSAALACHMSACVCCSGQTDAGVYQLAVLCPSLMVVLCNNEGILLSSGCDESHGDGKL